MSFGFKQFRFANSFRLLTSWNVKPFSGGGPEPSSVRHVGDNAVVVNVADCLLSRRSTLYEAVCSLSVTVSKSRAVSDRLSGSDKPVAVVL